MDASYDEKAISSWGKVYHKIFKDDNFIEQLASERRSSAKKSRQNNNK